MVRYHINDKSLHTLTVVVEDYLLYADKLEAQTYSKCETPRLLGILEYWCYSRNIPIVFQTAALVKKPSFTSRSLNFSAASRTF